MQEFLYIFFKATGENFGGFIITEEPERSFAQAENCGFVAISCYGEEDKNVRHPCHKAGSYRGAAHTHCILIIQQRSSSYKPGALLDMKDCETFFTEVYSTGKIILYLMVTQPKLMNIINVLIMDDYELLIRRNS